jgi:hypothetical protein
VVQIETLKRCSCMRVKSEGADPGCHSKRCTCVTNRTVIWCQTPETWGSRHQKKAYEQISACFGGGEYYGGLSGSQVVSQSGRVQSSYFRALLLLPPSSSSHQMTTTVRTRSCLAQHLQASLRLVWACGTL